MRDEPQKPVTPQEQKTADRIVQGMFLAALCICILIDAIFSDFDLHPVVYAILGAGTLGVDNFLRLLDAVKGRKS